MGGKNCCNPQKHVSQKKNRDLPLGVAYLLLLLDGCKEVQNQIFASTLTLS